VLWCKKEKKDESVQKLTKAYVFLY